MVNDALLKKFVEVLTYYADPKRYESGYSLEKGYIQAPIMRDRGRTAKNLLNQILQPQIKGETDGEPKS